MTEHCADDHCVTCADEAVEMSVLALAGDLARCVDEGGKGHDVAIDLVPGVVPGDVVLVHAGVALSVTENAERPR
jgi:hydrogenase expression/formation protein HypC